MWAKSKLKLSQHRAARTTAAIADDRLRMAADRFADLDRHLQQLHQRVQGHYENLRQATRSRAAVLETIHGMALHSPLQELVVGGSAEDAAAATTTVPNHDNDNNSNHTVSSYSSAMALQATQTNAQLQQYHRDIVSYVADWNKTVSTRVATELKHITALYKTWTKYEQKVDSLQATFQKKKRASNNNNNNNHNDKLQDKITWNESKLRTAKKEYRRNLIGSTLLIEEVTDRGWKDLVPLLIRMMDHDVNSTKNTKELVRGLSKVREDLVELARRYEMDFEAVHTGRLRILMEEDAIDFVDPEDLQDLESTVATNLKSVAVSPNSTPPCSEKDSNSTGEDNNNNNNNNMESRKSVNARVLSKEDQAPKKQEIDVVVVDDDGDDSCRVPNYPSSIYLVSGEGAVPVDDETTLTGAPDLASV